MIRFFFRATFWIGLFVYLMPSIIGSQDYDVEQTSISVTEERNFSAEVAKGVTEFCKTSPEVCEEGRQLATSVSELAVSTALSSAHLVLPNANPLARFNAPE